jgi:amino acid adenylation domain-containing protein
MPGTAARLRRVAGAYGLPAEALVLAAHLAVLATVSGERAVRTGCVGAGPAVVALRLPEGTWRELAAAADAALRAAPAAEAGATVPDTVVDLRPLTGAAAPAAAPAGDAVLAVGFEVDGDDLRVLLRHRLADLDGEQAERLAGYLGAALGLLLDDPDRSHRADSLLSEEELGLQIYGLSGPHAPVPQRSFSQLFDERVARHPDAVAAVWRGQRRSYAELGARADVIAAALLGEGVGAEDVVALAMERDLEWLAAVLAVFKAGGAYLPVRPDFPAERTRAQLVSSDCRVVLCTSSSRAAVPPPEADGGPRVLLAEQIGAEGADPGPGAAVDPGQLAYVYFTSGSTGEPKGAMCEHAGMLNHLLAKVEDLEIGEGTVVAQTASQAFDISLWQLVAPLLVGGTTHIIDEAVQLDVDRMLDELDAGQVEVLQVVPSYLDVLLDRLEREHRELPALRSVSVTGEALKARLVRRWFACYPHITLVNAYGATEVSDDTMHEVLHRPPASDALTVGRPLRNVHVYVLDDELRVAPLGSAGEITFSGVAVGRGYVNDPERTQQVFVPDPYRQGLRMYRTGDYGRWLPDGRLEFLGRLDEQVKVRGYRIEMGEIESRLLAVPGVAGAAVVVDGTEAKDTQLVAFVGAREALDLGGVRTALAEHLPDYMVPTYLHRLEQLPLNENGKVDKQRLRRLAATLGHAGAAYVAPVTPTETRIAGAWAEVLNVPLERIGRDDDFFALGGTSLAAVRLVVKLERLFPLEVLNRHPVLRDLAAAVEASDDGGGERAARPLLQRLSSPGHGPMATLVYFPYAAGNALNFQQVARALWPMGVAVHGAELPGHDLDGAATALLSIEEIALRAGEEVLASIDGPVLLWGHGAGAATALATALFLQARGRPPGWLLIAGRLLGDPDELRAEGKAVAALDDEKVVGRLRTDGAYVELEGLRRERAEIVGRAYRHDVRTAARYLLAAREDPGSYRLACPIDVVVAADDTATAGYAVRHRAWRLLADEVRLHVLPDGGHYFPRTRSAEAAAVVLKACSGLGHPGAAGLQLHGADAR